MIKHSKTPTLSGLMACGIPLYPEIKLLLRCCNFFYFKHLIHHSVVSFSLLSSFIRSTTPLTAISIISSISSYQSFETLSKSTLQSFTVILLASSFPFVLRYLKHLYISPILAHTLQSLPFTTRTSTPSKTFSSH